MIICHVFEAHAQRWTSPVEIPEKLKERRDLTATTLTTDIVLYLHRAFAGRLQDVPSRSWRKSVRNWLLSTRLCRYAKIAPPLIKVNAPKSICTDALGHFCFFQPCRICLLSKLMPQMSTISSRWQPGPRLWSALLDPSCNMVNLWSVPVSSKELTMSMRLQRLPLST